jgi:hypothetical protein
VLDPKPGEKGCEDESDEPAFLARQPEHRTDNMPQPGPGGKRRVGFARFSAMAARRCFVSGWSIQKNGF